MRASSSGAVVLIHSLSPVSKESFFYPETKPIFDLLEEVTRRSGVSRGQAFEDFLHMSLCALSGGQMEEQYMQTVQRHAAGEPGKRGCDSIAHAFGALVDAMEETRKDILGDLFQGGITYGEAGQFISPESICDMMARMTIEGTDVPAGVRKTVADCCCGSGRMLLAAAEIQPNWEFIGQDVDLRCVRMTAINLALRNRYGYVIWGNSLANERRLVYRTGFNLRGFVRELPPEERPPPVLATGAETPAVVEAMQSVASPAQLALPSDAPRHQLRLF